MTQKYPKRLIEVDLPIKRISAHARREKSIRHGHISTLHIWWARRPLAACRAVICASLWPDPADPLCPQSFRDRASKIVYDFASAAAHSKELGASCDHETWIKWQAMARNGTLDSDNEAHWNILRFALLDFIADFANWDNSTVQEYLDTSRALTQAAHEALGGEPGTRPLVVDPFAGGGSIPLEALRVGADAFASDLNPIPVLLNKVVLEYIPKYGQRLADEVRKWGDWIKQEAAKELEELYPKDSDGATSIAYLWARTVLSEAPDAGDLPVQVPLLRSMWLSKRKGSFRALRWVRDSQGNVKSDSVSIVLNGSLREVRLPKLEIFSPKNAAEVESGTARGGASTCPVTGFTTPPARVKEQLKLQRGGAQTSRLIAVYADGLNGRDFRLSVEEDLNAFGNASNLASNLLLHNADAFPTERINPIRPFKNTRGLSAVTRIGCETFGDLYNRRQALAIHHFYDQLRKCRSAHAGETDNTLLDAIQIALAFAIDRAVSQNTSLSRWDATRLTIKGAFSKQALAVVWDFAEANPFSGGTSDWDGAIDWVCRFIESNLSLCVSGTVHQGSATSISLPSDSAAALVTDPPYFAAIPYADLSDFFYVWLRRGIGKSFPELFVDSLTQKEDELIVTNAEKTKDGKQKDDAYFRGGMALALSSARDVVKADGVGLIVYAEGTTAGWEAMLGAIIDSHWTVTSSWPIDTEMENRTQAHGAASLQSSIHIVCRPRVTEGVDQVNEVGDWRDVLLELPKRIHEWMPRLADEGVVGADAIFACLGPALEIFSRYSHVEKANGDAVMLREYLEQVWAAVAKEALAQVFKGADATGFEPDARLTAMWLWTLNAPSAIGNAEEGEEEDGDEDEAADTKKPKLAGFKLEYDAARKIAQGLGAALENLTHLVEVKGDEARLLPVAERTRHLFGKEQEEAARPIRKKASAQLNMFAELTESEDTETAWQEKTVTRMGDTALDRVHQAMILFAAGRGEALKRFVVDDGVGRDGKFWRLAQALSALYPTGTDERRWVEGLMARKKQFGF
jgi:adenine-specific DNA methylase